MTKNKLLTLLLSVVVAFALWMYVISVVSPESEETFYNVPVYFEGEGYLEKEKLVIVGERPTVTLKLTGNRSDLSKLDASKIYVSADVSMIYKTGKHKLAYDVDYMVDNIADGAIGVLSQDPGTVIVNVERLVKDEPFAVEVVPEGELKSSYKIHEMRCSVDEVLVTGPASVVDKIDQVRIDVDVNGKSESFTKEEQRFTFYDDGKVMDVSQLTLNVETANATIIVHKTKEVTLSVEKRYGAGVTKENSTVTISPKTVEVSYLETDDAVKVPDVLNIGTIDLSRNLDSLPKTFPIQISGFEGVYEMAEARVTVELLEFQEKQLEISKFEITQLPEGLEAELPAEPVTVWIRVSPELAERLQPEDVTIQLDLTGAKAGTFHAAAKAVIENPVFAGAVPLAVENISLTVTELDNAH